MLAVSDEETYCKVFHTTTRCLGVVPEPDHGDGDQLLKHCIEVVHLTPKGKI